MFGLFVLCVCLTPNGKPKHDNMCECVFVVVSNRRCHRHLGRHFELQQWASTVGGNETCVCVLLNIDGRSIGLKFYRLF